VLRAGKYSVWSKTPLAEAIGVVVLAPDGTLSGGDTIIATRHSPGPGSFGEVDDLEVTLTGRSKGRLIASCTGTAKQAPGQTLEATLVRMADG
jgi:hypothetical protein